MHPINDKAKKWFYLYKNILKISKIQGKMYNYVWFKICISFEQSSFCGLS